MSAVPTYAHNVKIHDEILNHGIVDAKVEIGVFIVFYIRGTVWSLGNGKGDIVKRDLVMHQQDTLYIWDRNATT